MLTGTDSQLIHGSRPPLELPARDARLGLAHRLRDAFQNLASSAAMIALAAGLADCSKSGRMVLSIAQEGKYSSRLDGHWGARHPRWTQSGRDIRRGRCADGVQGFSGTPHKFDAAYRRLMRAAVTRSFKERSARSKFSVSSLYLQVAFGGVLLRPVYGVPLCVRNDAGSFSMRLSRLPAAILARLDNVLVVFCHTRNCIGRGASSTTRVGMFTD